MRPRTTLTTRPSGELSCSDRRADDAGAISAAGPSHNDEGVFVIMAGQEVISPQIKTLSAGEANHLADRLYSRSVSKMFVASPEVRIDLCMASRVIRSLISQVDRLASECEDRAHLLRSLKIDVAEC
jgi:hypothetical protein